MPVKKPFVTPLKARGSAAFSHEAEDLVVFSPRLYKVLLIQICNLRQWAMLAAIRALGLIQIAYLTLRVEKKGEKLVATGNIC